MSYTPTNWKSGDVVTSTKLNKMEQGIAGNGLLICTEDSSTHALNYTYKEIVDAGYAVLDYEMVPNAHIVLQLSQYANLTVAFSLYNGNDFVARMYVAQSENDYPVYTQGG